jgi:hypothetical protein
MFLLNAICSTFFYVIFYMLLIFRSFFIMFRYSRVRVFKAKRLTLIVVT